MRFTIGIDLGTAGIRMVEAGYPSVLDVPSRLAFRHTSTEPQHFGEEAAMLEGRIGADGFVASPLKDGVLENSLYAERLIFWMLSRQDESRRTRRPSLLCTCAPHARPVQIDALVQTALNAGFSEATLLRADVSAALGAGMNLASPEGSMLIDVGDGHMTASVFTMNRLAASETLPYGLNRVDGQIIRAIRDASSMTIGPRTAQEIKHALLTASERFNADTEMAVAGIDILKRTPVIRKVSAAAAQPALESLLRELVQMCTRLIESLPEELAADLAETGAMLTGGGAVLEGLDKRLGDALGIPCRVADASSTAAARGLSVCINDPKRLESALFWAIPQRSGR